MYLNGDTGFLCGEFSTVTETWDVFKQRFGTIPKQLYVPVTETWDVFKLNWRNFANNYHWSVTETWDVFKRESEKAFDIDSNCNWNMRCI